MELEKLNLFSKSKRILKMTFFQVHSVFPVKVGDSASAGKIPFTVFFSIEDSETFWRGKTQKSNAEAKLRATSDTRRTYHLN